jgi:uncharacterized Tic20 family protein
MAEHKAVQPKKKTAQSKDPALVASLAHFSILLVLIIGPFSILVPLLIWLLERSKPDRSKVIEFQGKQAFYYQAAVYIISLILGGLIGILSVILIGVLLIPVLVLFGIAAIVYGTYAGVKVYQGEKFRYIYVADFIESRS